MREIIARAVSVLTVAIVVGLSFVFAAEHNHQQVISEPFDGTSESPREATRATPAVAEVVNDPIQAIEAAGDGERGRAIYTQQKCATCHSIAGEGNPRNPLEGAGTRWDAEELRDWVIGEGVAKEVISPTIFKRKQRYKNIPEEDMKALVAYLLQLKS